MGDALKSVEAYKRMVNDCDPVVWWLCKGPEGGDNACGLT